AGDGPRTANTLHAKIAAVRAKNEDKRPLLPNSMLHDLRAALFLGRRAANHAFDLVRHRYPGFAALFDPGPNGMFFPDDTGVYRTHLLDALDLVGFWPEDRP
ncbi:MAG TPA: hypothetical protein VH092_35275, partial [Urbifossiella sp.]|nr:hypothetical protein [Urbifossiella sp.]